MKALVTGGCGYFGDLLTEHLLKSGHQVRIFDLDDGEPHREGAEYRRADIRDRDAIAAACVGMDWVFHNVAQVPLAKDRALFWSVNRDGTENLLRAAAAAKVRKVVHTSSSAVYGRPLSNPVTEDTAPAPLEDYGRAKLAAEQLCLEHAAEGLDVTIIRPRTILGPGRLGIFQILFEWVRQGVNIPVLGSGDNRFQFVHAADLAQACLLAAARPGAEAYNCGAERFGTMREALEELCRHARTDSQVRSVPKAPAVALMRLCSALGLSPLGPYHVMYGEELFFDISKAVHELGWKPRYSNFEMLMESYNWYAANRERVLSTSGSSFHRSAVSPGALSLLKHLL
ncbi:MAG: NAD-dependent epimerase/dehydratase family protein [Elusimicrobia bacterium]|nr:NAD-dependent epimerase/dehydratase family protein [Elusimicrobiota bacterium]